MESARRLSRSVSRGRYLLSVQLVLLFHQGHQKGLCGGTNANGHVSDVDQLCQVWPSDAGRLWVGVYLGAV